MEPGYWNRRPRRHCGTLRRGSRRRMRRPGSSPGAPCYRDRTPPPPNRTQRRTGPAAPCSRNAPRTASTLVPRGTTSPHCSPPPFPIPFPQNKNDKAETLKKIENPRFWKVYLFLYLRVCVVSLSLSVSFSLSLSFCVCVYIEDDEGKRSEEYRLFKSLLGRYESPRAKNCLPRVWQTKRQAVELCSARHFP